MYAVFGISKARARRIVMENLDNPIGKSLDEFAAEWNDKSENVYKNLKPARISNSFSNLAEAEQYMHLLVDSKFGRDCVIKKGVRFPGTNPKNGKPYSIDWE